MTLRVGKYIPETLVAIDGSPANQKPGYTYQMITLFASYGMIDRSWEMIETYLEHLSNRNTGVSYIVEAVLARDDFKDIDVAFLDTDKDGKPDFFYPWVTPTQILESGLELDDDIDGDGTADDADLTPYYAD